MEKIYREMLDIIRAEVADLYRLRRVDAERLCRLERSARRETAARSCGRCVAECRPGSGDKDAPVIWRGPDGRMPRVCDCSVIQRV